MILDIPILAAQINPIRPARQAVEHLLRTVWVPYMHGSGGKPRGCPNRASGGIQNYTSMDLDNVEAYERLDKTIGEKIDAAIADLTPVEQCAVHHTYLHAVYRFQRDTLERVMDNALLKLEIGLRTRNVWLGA